MSFTNPLGDRKDDLRFHNPQSAKDETASRHSRYPTSLIGNGARTMPTHTPSQAGDLRAGLSRRFTTESAMLPTLPPIGPPGSQTSKSSKGQTGEKTLDLSNSTLHKIQLLEKKKLEREMLREHRRMYEEELRQIELRQQRDEREIAEMTEELGRVQGPGGHQSEPTTPPEYRESTFPPLLSHPHRYSASSMMPPPGLRAHTDSTASQFTSASTTMGPPQSTPSKTTPSKSTSSKYTSSKNTPSKMPSKSVPGSRRNSDEKELEDSYPEEFMHRPAAAFNRNSMPALSATSAALDLALSQSPGPESQQSNGSPASSRHRPAQHSLPANSLQTAAFESNDASGVGLPQTRLSNPDVQRKVLRFDRQSTDLKMTPLSEGVQAISHGAALLSNSAHTISPPKLQSSYSANDIPTVKSTESVIGANMATNTKAQQGIQGPNASMGQVTPIAAPRATRNSADGEVISASAQGLNAISQPLRSALQATTPHFGPMMSSTGNAMQAPGAATPPAMQSFWFPNYYNQAAMAMNNMHLGLPIGPSGNPFAQLQFYSDYGRTGASQPWHVIQRRLADGDASRFANAQLEDFRGEIYFLCKDQHGCRFLQKKLEEGNPEHLQLIFTETSPYVQELMIDPFGNYLCQKLIEYATDEQRTAIVNNALPQLARIALNQHGTRALQKMIDFISTPEQIQGIIRGLKDRVVQLIQDLNGNHVIQKCLNRLTPTDAQFIFDAVGANCVVVGTHRHGCCVLQRCVDHASGVQKVQLISQISMHVFALVKDPFGNYVVQYLLDLGDTTITEPLMRRFLGQVPALSKHKFSSNVIEKCLRTAEPGLRQKFIEEMLQPQELGKLLRDPYANYVIQTAMDFADPATRARLIENIRPHLPAIRTTPYGRRIQGKIHTIEGRSGNSSGQMTPNEAPGSGQIPLEGQHIHRPPTSGPVPAPNNFFVPMSPFGNVHMGQGNSNMTGAVTTPVSNTAGIAQQAVPQINSPLPGSVDNNNQATMQQPFVSAYGRPAQPGSGYYFF